MKIIHLEASPGWGGQEMRILRESEGMRARGHEVILIVAQNGKLIPKARAQGFTVYECNFQKWNWPRLLFQLLNIFKKHHINLINTHSSLDSWIGGIAARIAKICIVRTRHLSSPIKAGLNSRILYGKLADFVVTTCQEMVTTICTQSGRPTASCRSIATGVDPQKTQTTSTEIDAFRRKLNLTPSHFLVGTACFMRSWKGIKDLLKSAQQLRMHPHIRWVIIGGGHAAEYIRFAQELQLNDIVHFTGHLDHPFPALGALDAFALLSTGHEGISQAILQAAYLKKPLIATPTGGLKEICIDQVTGLQVPPFSPEKMTKSVLQLYEHPSLCAQFGEAAHRLVEDQFTIQKTLDEMERVYTQMNSKIGQ